MVFCGKPSKGCSSCRKRRIKCDQLEPSCSQCIRSEKSCPGYRDVQALMFRDENAKVIRKTRNVSRPTKSAESSKESQRIPKAPTADSTPPSKLDSKCQENNAEDGERPRVLEAQLIYLNSTLHNFPSGQLSAAVQDEGVTFFFNNYMTFMSSAPGGHFDVFSSPLWKDVGASRQIFEAVSSVGLAGLANVKQDQETMLVARKKYSETMEQVRSALQNPESMEIDHIFKAIIILALFEIVDSTAETHDSWNIHIDGAAALLSTGKLTRFPLRRTPRVQLHFCFSIMISHLHRGKEVSLAITNWSQDCRASLSPEDAPAGVLLNIVIRLINFLASIKSNKDLEPNDILQQALSLEEDSEGWSSTKFTDQWRYPVVKNPDKIAYLGQYHVYKDFWIAKIWNHYRWARILINELILTNIVGQQASLEKRAQQQKSLAIISQLASDICTSVSGELCRFTVTPDSVENSQPQMSGIFMVLFPMHVAGRAVGVSEETHQWAIKMLGNIGQTMGIHEAVNLGRSATAARERWMKAGLHVICDES